ncbi:hypothetical protein FLP10_15190 [Agromyces intestinalis]|uniref:Uncharacterized protein n=1 Tax=Agromyces intestinalis TaxID=2592652 RepID=A0A5C1YHG2_9MICO|nr:hypothetical protein [Agromyces intestinalis]QEO15624.1 hypothetical protein FLP10_15190 [Agromyces intestinalis]
MGRHDQGDGAERGEAERDAEPGNAQPENAAAERAHRTDRWTQARGGHWHGANPSTETSDRETANHTDGETPLAEND